MNLSIFFAFIIIYNLSKNTFFIFRNIKEVYVMDKLNSGLFNLSKSNFDFLNFEVQPKLFVNIPKQTNVDGKLFFAKK